MADQDQKSVFGNITPQPDQANDTRRRGTDNDDDNVSVNDEDADKGGLRSDRPERLSTADDMDNPRTGPIG